MRGAKYEARGSGSGLTGRWGQEDEGRKGEGRGTRLRLSILGSVVRARRCGGGPPPQTCGPHMVPEVCFAFFILEGLWHGWAGKRTLPGNGKKAEG